MKLMLCINYNLINKRSEKTIKEILYNIHFLVGELLNELSLE